MKTKPKKPVMSGGAKLAASGRKPILIAVTPDEYKTLLKAATQDDRKLGPWIRLVALRVAVEKSRPVKRKS